MIHWGWLIVALLVGLCLGLWIRSHEVAGIRLAAGRIYDAKLEADQKLRLAENWNKNITKDLDHCARERENLEAIIHGYELKAIETLAHFGIPDTTEAKHD